MDRLEKIQSQLYENQMQVNKSFENKTINVLVENFTDDKTQVFGRSEYMTSVIFSPRPGTKAEGLDLIDKKISMKRLEFVQNLLSENQTQMNKKLENRTIDVLVENLTEDKSKAFGRTEYMTSVIFNGKKDDIGKIVPVKINRSNRSTLFGEKDLSHKQKVA